MQQLLWHYSPGPGAQRGVKDMRGVALLKAATLAMGGGRTVVCKSGKDRTAMVRARPRVAWSDRQCASDTQENLQVCVRQRG